MAKVDKQTELARVAWEGVKSNISCSIPIGKGLGDWNSVQFVNYENEVLTISSLTSYLDEAKRRRPEILQAMQKYGIKIRFVEIVAPQPRFTVTIAEPSPDDTPKPTPAPTVEPPKTLQAEIESLKAQLAAETKRADFYEALADNATTHAKAGGLNLAILLPYLPQLPNATAKAILTLLALGGEVHMTAREFAENMGWKPDGVTYKRMFTGAEDLVNIAGKNVDMPSISPQKIDTVSTSENTGNTEKLIPRQFPENEKLTPYQFSESEIDTVSTSTPPHDMNECNKKITPLRGSHSFMSQADQNEVLRFASDQIEFNAQFAPERLKELDPVKAMALVLQAKHHPTKRNPAGLWKEMVKIKQRPSKRWIDAAWEYSGQYSISTFTRAVEQAS